MYPSLEAVPEAQREDYVERAVDGKNVYVLDVESADGFDLQNVGSVTAELSRLREQSPRLKAFEALGQGPKALTALLDELVTLKENSGGESEQVAKLQEEIKLVKAGLESAIGEATSPLKSQNSTMREQLEMNLKTEKLTAAIVAAGGGDSLDLLLPALSQGVQVLFDEETGKARTVVVGEDGVTPRLGTDLQEFTIAKLVEERKSQPAFQPAFAGSGQSGRGTETDGERSTGGAPMTEEQISNMSQAEYRKARSEGGALADI
jgi:hypothetical protein